MQLAMIGLGRMGGNMAQRLINNGHRVVVLDRGSGSAKKFIDQGCASVSDISQLRDALMTPRVAWVMAPAGDATEQAIEDALEAFEPGDVIIDGGNSNYKQSIARSSRCSEKQVQFVDAGVSGGIWGLENGYCIMAGGDDSAIAIIRPACEALAPDGAFAHVGPSGSGHFVKMVHNGIEYGMMQSFAEGFELMHAKPEFGLDLHQVARVWQHNSVVRSWLLDLAERALADPDEFAKVRGYVEDSGEGRWTIDAAVEHAVPMPAITASLFARFASRQGESFAARINAALRNQFGGHAMKLTGGQSSGTSAAPK